MLNNITIGKYHETHSFFHQIHPVIKLFTTLLFVFSILKISYFWMYGIVGIFLLFSLYLTNIPFITYLKSVWKLKYFFLFLILINWLFGIPILESILMVIQIILILWITMILLYTTSIQDLIYALSILLYPLKLFRIQTNQLAYSIGISIHFIPIILEQETRVMKSLYARGIHYSKLNIKDKFHLLQSIMLPILDISLKKADQLAELMELRCYNLNSNYLIKRKKSVTRNDILYVGIHVLFCIWIWKEVV